MIDLSYHPAVALAVAAQRRRELESETAKHRQLRTASTSSTFARMHRTLTGLRVRRASAVVAPQTGLVPSPG